MTGGQASWTPSRGRDWTQKGEVMKLTRLLVPKFFGSLA